MNYLKKIATTGAVLAMALSMGVTGANAAQGTAPGQDKKAAVFDSSVEPTPINMTMGRYTQEVFTVASIDTATNTLNLNFSGNANLTSGSYFDVTYMCGNKEAGKPTPTQMIGYWEGKATASFATPEKNKCAIDGVKLTSAVDPWQPSSLWFIDENSPIIPVTSTPTTIDTPQDTTPIFPTESITGSDTANGVFWVNGGNGYMVPSDTTWNVDYSVSDDGTLDYKVSFSDKTLSGYGQIFFSDDQYGGHGDILVEYYAYNGEAVGTFDNGYRSIDGANLEIIDWQSNLQNYYTGEHYQYDIVHAVK